MKKLLLVSAIAAALPITAMAKPSVAKNLGQGVTGVTGDFTNAQFNPALLARFDQSDDVYLSLGGGVLGSDKDELIDTIEDTQELIDLVEGRIEQGTADINDAEAIFAAMEELDGKALTLDQGLNLMIALPMNWASLGIFVNQEARISTQFNFDENDTVERIKEYINDNQYSSNPELGDVISSSASVIGFSIAEAGLTIAKTYSGKSYDVNYGTSLKYQRLDLFNYSDTINAFDEDDFDAEEYLVDDSQLNLDVGVQIAWGDQRQWQFGLVGKNLLGFDLQSAADPLGNAYRLELDPTATAGLSYDNGWFRIAADADLMPHSEFVPAVAVLPETLTIPQVQYASAGIELDAWEWLQLRVGYRTDMRSSVEDVITAGIGLSPFDVLSLDISGAVGDNDTYGGAIQLGLKF